jgi:hypothetical protein
LATKEDDIRAMDKIAVDSMDLVENMGFMAFIFKVKNVIGFYR